MGNTDCRSSACTIASATIEIGLHFVPSSTGRRHAIADNARLGEGTIGTADRLKLCHSSIPSGGVLDAFHYASDAIEDSSDAIQNLSDSKYYPHSFLHHAEFREAAPTVAEQGTPSTQESEGPHVAEPPFGGERWFEYAQPTDEGLDAAVRRLTIERR